MSKNIYLIITIVPSPNTVFSILHCEHVEHGFHVCLAGLRYQALHEDLGRVEAQLLQPVREEVRLDLLDL